MASYQSVTLHSSEYDKLVKQFGTELTNAYKAMKGLQANYQALMKGDSRGPYWNGAVALQFYKAARSNMDKDIVAYNAVFKIYKKLMDRQSNLIRKGYLVK